MPTFCTISLTNAHPKGVLLSCSSLLRGGNGPWVHHVSVLWFLNNFLNDAIARCFHLHSQLRCDLRVQKSLEVNRVRTMITDSSHFSSFLHHVITLHLGFPAQTTTGSGSGSVQVASAYTCTPQELFEVTGKLKSQKGIQRIKSVQYVQMVI